MSIDGELAAIRAIARSLGNRGAPPEPRRLGAWASQLGSAARGIERGVLFLRAQAEAALPQVAPAESDGGRYAGLPLRDALLALAGQLLGPSQQPGMVALVHREVDELCNALSASVSTSARLPAAPATPDADSVGKVRRDARATSRKAALHVAPKTGTQRRRIFDAVAAVARDPRVVGLTDVELQRQTGMSPNSERPRRVELVEGGWLEASEQTREHYGAEHTVWVLTAKGMREAASQ